MYNVVILLPLLLLLLAYAQT